MRTPKPAQVDWVLWAIVLAVVARLFWVRGRESAGSGRLVVPSEPSPAPGPPRQTCYPNGTRNPRPGPNVLGIDRARRTSLRAWVEGGF